MPTAPHTTRATRSAQQSGGRRRNAAPPKPIPTSPRTTVPSGNLAEPLPFQRAICLTIIGYLLITPIHIVYGCLCWAVNAAVNAFVASNELPKKQPPTRTRHSRRVTAPPVRPREVKAVVSSSSDASSSDTDEHASASEDDEHRTTSSDERKALPAMLKKLAHPAQMINMSNITNNITNFKAHNFPRRRSSAVDSGNSLSTTDSTNRSTGASLPRRMSFNQVQRIIPAVGRRRAMSDAAVPVLPANSAPATNKRRAASLPNPPPSSTNAPPGIPAREPRPDGRPLLAPPRVTFDQQHGSPTRICIPKRVREPSRARSDSAVTLSSSSSSSNSTELSMLDTSIEEEREDIGDSDTGTTDNGATRPPTAASGPRRLAKLRRKVERSLVLRSRTLLDGREARGALMLRLCTVEVVPCTV
ncbi:hypothetical protein EVJ58_g561 [Rhodofomes roseus]|uniref:Uncharacterized protein n=1 Tax=Rhodofomes roseus TaxID=34475 RepID=A0A4Y9Z3S7_9APHY|nr:hypothetical protein EVJ58_g561 [Rhodofomes roseus]